MHTLLDPEASVVDSSLQLLPSQPLPYTALQAGLIAAVSNSYRYPCSHLRLSKALLLSHRGAREQDICRQHEKGLRGFPEMLRPRCSGKLHSVVPQGGSDIEVSLLGAGSHFFQLLEDACVILC